jgi:hypothetical protein
MVMEESSSLMRCDESLERSSKGSASVSASQSEQ